MRTASYRPAGRQPPVYCRAGKYMLTSCTCTGASTPHRASACRAASCKVNRFRAAQLRASVWFPAGQAASRQASTASRTRSLAFWSATESLAARMCSRRVSAHTASPVCSWVRLQTAACHRLHSKSPSARQMHRCCICRRESILPIKKQTLLLEMISRGWACKR